MEITADRTIFNMDLEMLKQQPIWSVRRSSAEYYMGNSLYILGMVSWRETEESPWFYYGVSLTETLACTNVPRWYQINLANLYDNTLVDHVVYAEAEKIFQSQM